MTRAGEGRVGGERGVRGQVVARVVGGGQHLDAEALVQRPRPVGVRRPAARRSGRRCASAVCRGRAARATPKISASSLSSQYRTGVPRSTSQCAHSSRHDLAGLGLGQRPAAHAERVQRRPRWRAAAGSRSGRAWTNRLAGSANGVVVEQQPRVDVPVRGDDRQVAHGLVEPPGDRRGPRARRAAAGRGASRSAGCSGGHALMVGAPTRRDNRLPVVAVRALPAAADPRRLERADPDCWRLR